MWGRMTGLLEDMYNASKQATCPHRTTNRSNVPTRTRSWQARRLALGDLVHALPPQTSEHWTARRSLGRDLQARALCDDPRDNMHPAVIMQRIKGTKSLFGLNLALKACSKEFNAIHTSAALLQLAQLASGSQSGRSSSHQRTHSGSNATSTTIAPPWNDGARVLTGVYLTNENTLVKPLLEGLLAQLQVHKDFMDCCGLANTVQALGLLQHYDAGLMQTLSDTILSRMSQFTLPQLTSIIRGMAQLQSRPSQAWRSSFYSAFEAAMHTSLHTVRSPSTRHSLHSTNHSTTPSTTEVNSCAAGCLWALQTLDCRPPTAWLAGILSLVSQQQAAPSDVATIVHSLARLKYVPSAAWLNKLLDCSHQTLKQQLAKAQMVSGPQQVHDEPVHVNPGHTWQLPDMLQLLWGLVHLKVSIPVSWLLTWCQVAAPLLPSKHPKEAVMLLHALSVIQQPSDGPSKQPVSALTAIQIGSSKTSSSSSSQGSSSAALPAPDTDMLLSRLIKQLVERSAQQVLDQSSQCNLKELVLAMTYCARLNIQPSRDWVHCMLQRVKPRLGSASNLDLAQIPYSIAKLKVRIDIRQQRMLLRLLRPRLQSCSPQELGNALWGLAHVRARPGTGWLVHAAICIQAAHGRLQAREARQLSFSMCRLAGGQARLRVLALSHSEVRGAVLALMDTCQHEGEVAFLQSVLSSDHFRGREHRLLLLRPTPGKSQRNKVQWRHKIKLLKTDKALLVHRLRKPVGDDSPDEGAVTVDQPLAGTGLE